MFERGFGVGAAIFMLTIGVLGPPDDQVIPSVAVLPTFRMRYDLDPVALDLTHHWE